jgi:hypothetical protein
MPFPCPVCGYARLAEPPRNFSICPSCGTEFGYDDSSLSHTELMFRWIKAGAPWFSKATRPPDGWNPWLQLIDAGRKYAVPFHAEIHMLQPNIARGGIRLPAVEMIVQYS